MSTERKKKFPLWILVASTLMTILLNPNILSAFLHGFIALAAVEFLGGFILFFAIFYIGYWLYSKIKS